MSKLAINGGSKVRNSSFPAWPFYDETEREALNRVLDSRNWWANQGTEVKTFEKEWTAFTNAKASFAVTNGTHTLEVIFWLLLRVSSVYWFNLIVSPTFLCSVIIR